MGIGAGPTRLLAADTTHISRPIMIIYFDADAREAQAARRAAAVSARPGKISRAISRRHADGVGFSTVTTFSVCRYGPPPPECRARHDMSDIYGLRHIYPDARAARRR